MTKEEKYVADKIEVLEKDLSICNTNLALSDLNATAKATLKNTKQNISEELAIFKTLKSYIPTNKT